jgi:hypothetical protein
MGRRTDPADRSDHGAVMVEFAFAFPVLLLAVVAGLSLLWAAFVQVSAGQAAREGARYASVALPPTYRSHPDAAAVVDRVRDRVPALRLTAGDIDVQYPSCPTCSSAPANAPVVVTVSKSLPSPVAAFARIFGASGTIVASSQGEVRAE